MSVIINKRLRIRLFFTSNILRAQSQYLIEYCNKKGTERFKKNSSNFFFSVYHKGKPLIFFWLCLFFLQNSNAQTIKTVAGSGINGFSGDGSAATTARFSYPIATCTDRSGNIYIADNSNHRIRKINIQTGIITTICGTGNGSYNGDNILATSASIYYPAGIALDTNDNIYIADKYNNRIRKINAATGIITTIAGSGTSGFSGDGGGATFAMLNRPTSVFVDANNNILIVDLDNQRIRKVTATTGIITTIAGNGVRSSGGDGGLAVNANLNTPYGLCTDTSGHIYIADMLNSRVRKVDIVTGIITTVAGTSSSGYEGDGGLAINAKLNNPTSVVIDKNNDLYIADRVNHRIRKVSSNTGIINTIIGTGSGGFTGNRVLGTQARINLPYHLWVDRNLVVYVSDTYNFAVRVYTSTNTWTGSSDTDWKNKTNWSLGSIPTAYMDAAITASGNAPVINAGDSISVNNLIINTNGQLTVNGKITIDDTLTVKPGGAILGNYSNLSGTAEIQQTISGQRGWRIFSNPFQTSQTLTTIASRNRITINTAAGNILSDTKTYHNATNTWLNVNTSIAPNTPYALFIRGLASEVSGNTYSSGPSAFTYGITGLLNRSSVTISPFATGFTLAGNPFAAPVSSSALTNGSGKPFYVYTIIQGNTLAAQRSRSGSWQPVLSSSPAQTIPTMGVIAYQAGEATNYTVTTNHINNSGIPQNNVFSNWEGIPHLELLVKYQDFYQDKLFIRLDSMASDNGKDPGDLEKIMNDFFNLYSVSTDKTLLSVDARNAMVKNIPLGLNGPVGAYVFNIKNHSIVKNGKIILKDNFERTEKIINANASYHFMITPDSNSKGTKRFELIFKKTNTEDNALINTHQPIQVNIYENPTRNNEISVDIKNATTKLLITVFDAAGKKLHTMQGLNGKNRISIGSQKGVYIITISSVETVFAQKIIKL